MKKTLMLVEDDDVLRANLQDFLEMHGYQVRAHADRISALSDLRSALPDIAILDIYLGSEPTGGFMLCRELRQLSTHLPIIFLTSHDGESERLLGLEFGADDHLSKHLSFEFLLFRLEALLDRYRALLGERASAASQLPPLVCGALELDRERRIATWEGEVVSLPLTHYWLVEDLASRPGEVRSHEDLMRAARTRVAPNTIAAHISLIRRRFKAVAPGFGAIRTERALGYRWVDGEG